MIRKLSFWVGLSAVVCLSACKEHRTIELELLYQSQHCSLREQGISVLNNAQLARTLASAQAFSLNKAKPDASLDSSEMGIFVSWGTQPNAGYRLKLSKKLALIDSNELTLPIEYIEPGPGLNYAQVITSPCIILKAQKVEDLKRISAGSLSVRID